MIDINLIRKTPDVVRENIRKKFQDSKLPLVDEVIELDRKNREAMQQAGILTATPLVVNRSPQQVHPLALGNLEAGSALLEVPL